MSIKLNHIIIPAYNSELSANFLARILGLPAPIQVGPFMMVKTNNDVDLDFMTTSENMQPRHYAFLVSEPEFDQIFARIAEENLTYWDSFKQENPGTINHSNGGRGLYFLDPNGHLLEVMTRPYI